MSKDDKSSESSASFVANAKSPTASEPALSDKQLAAVEALVSGKNVAESAALAGVNRATVFRWLKHDAVFQAAFNAWRRETVAAAQAQFLCMVCDAVAALRNAVRQGNLRAVLAVLKSTGALDPVTIGSEDPAEVQQEIKTAERLRRMAHTPGLDPELQRMMMGMRD